MFEISYSKKQSAMNYEKEYDFLRKELDENKKTSSKGRL